MTRTITIQKTGKGYKAISAMGWALILGSILLFFNHHGALSAYALAAGIAAKIIARIGAWWNHG